MGSAAVRGADRRCSRDAGCGRKRCSRIASRNVTAASGRLHRSQQHQAVQDDKEKQDEEKEVEEEEREEKERLREQKERGKGEHQEEEGKRERKGKSGLLEAIPKRQ